MHLRILAALFLLLAAGCESSPVVRPDTPADPNPPMRPGGPNWEAIDQTVQRVKDRENGKPRLVETDRSTSQGFPTMSDTDYNAALDSARADVRKANPKMSDADVEAEATKRADHAKFTYEHSVSSSASSSYELKKPE